MYNSVQEHSLNYMTVIYKMGHKGDFIVRLNINMGIFRELE